MLHNPLVQQIKVFQMANIKGTSGDDTLFGTTGDDVLNIQDRGGNDTMYGGPTSLTNQGAVGNDTFFGGQGNDTAIGGSGNDTFRMSDGNDHATGGAGNDRMIGGAGNDGLNGGKGDDFISGGDGVDTLTGGAGFDTFNFTFGDTGLVAPHNNLADKINDFTQGQDQLALNGGVVVGQDVIFNSTTGGGHSILHVEWLGQGSGDILLDKVTTGITAADWHS